MSIGVGTLFIVVANLALQRNKLFVPAYSFYFEIAVGNQYQIDKYIHSKLGINIDTVNSKVNHLSKLETHQFTKKNDEYARLIHRQYVYQITVNTYIVRVPIR